jgi:NAD(P)-dependent dehydrogenase (short-subunit alcohol dehydrogenase family)
MTTALITSATGGIGFQVAASLSRQGMRVIVTGRDEARGRQAVTELKAQAGHDGVELLLADASLVRDNLRLADEIGQCFQRLDVLVNNAGGGGHPERVETSEGIESTLALNFVGPFALTTHLLPLLTRSESRIVNIVSSAFEMWKRDPFDDVSALAGYVGIEAYAHAKLLNLVATMALARRLAGTGVVVYAVNPGMAWTPNVSSLTPEFIPQWRSIWPLMRWIQRRASAEAAARGAVHLASAPNATPSGTYFDGQRARKLPLHLQDSAVQDRALALAKSLVSQALAETSSTRRH